MRSSPYPSQVIPTHYVTFTLFSIVATSIVYQARHGTMPRHHACTPRIDARHHVGTTSAHHTTHAPHHMPHAKLLQSYQEFAISYSGVCPININLHFFLDGCAFTFGGARGSTHQYRTWAVQRATGPNLLPIPSPFPPPSRRVAHHLRPIQRRDAAPH